MKQKFSVIALLSILAALVAFGSFGGTLNAAAQTKAATTAATKAATTAGTKAAGTAAAAGTTAPTAAPATLGAAVDVKIPGVGKITAGVAGEAKNLTGSGATFPAPIYAAWFNAYKGITGVQVNYGGGGSGKGITDLSGQTVDFAGTDAYLSDDQLKAAKGGDIVHIPTVAGAVVMTYNLAQVKDQIKLAPSDIAKIYELKITKWNDPALVKNNPALASVNVDIKVVRRNDSSGTTNIFTSYLAAVDQEWATTYKSGTTVNWAEGTIGGQGNDGVAGTVSQTPGAIGYVELIFALKNKLGYAQVQNAAGNFIVPSLAGVTSAARGFLPQTPDDLRIKIVNGQGADAYPISGYTWIIAYTKQTDAAKSLALVRLLWWMTHDGQQYATNLGYAALPAEVVAKAEANIAKIGVDGKASLPADILNSGAMKAMGASSTMAATMAMMAPTMAATK